MSCVQGVRAALEQAVKMVTNPLSSTISLWRYGQYGKDRLAADAAKVSPNVALSPAQCPGPLRSAPAWTESRRTGTALQQMLPRSAQTKWCLAVTQVRRS